jgi:hypothetical protein
VNGPAALLLVLFVLVVRHKWDRQMIVPCGVWGGKTRKNAVTQDPVDRLNGHNGLVVLHHAEVVLKAEAGVFGNTQLGAGQVVEATTNPRDAMAKLVQVS